MLRQSPSSSTSSPAEISISSKYLSAIPFSPAAVVPRLKTWSDSAPEETYASYSPIRDSDGLQILLTRSLSNYQTLSSEIYTPKSPVERLTKILFSRIYAQDSPVEYLLTFPQPSLCMRSSNSALLDLYHPQQCLNSRLGQIVHRRNQSYHPSFSPSRISAHIIIKQHIRIFLKMDMF